MKIAQKILLWGFMVYLAFIFKASATISSIAIQGTNVVLN